MRLEVIAAAAILAGCALQGIPSRMYVDGITTAAARRTPLSSVSRMVPESQLFVDYHDVVVTVRWDEPFSSVRVTNSLIYAPVDIWYGDHEGSPDAEVGPQSQTTLPIGRDVHRIRVMQAFAQPDPGPGLTLEPIL